MSMPESDPRRAIIQGALVGALGEVPVVGGALAGAVQAGLDARAREADEEWWAMLAARVSSVETELGRALDYGDPEFVAAAFRLTRAAQETADREKRERLAAALAHAGSWAELPKDERERMERLVEELTSREVFLLKVLSDPREWLREHDPNAIQQYENMTGSPAAFLDRHISRGDSVERLAVSAAVNDLQRRGLVDFPTGAMMSGSGILQPRTTPMGILLISYLTSIGA